MRIVRAELGLFAEPPPLIPAELMAQHERHDWHTVEGTNHYDVLVGPIGAEAVADTIVAAVAAQR